MAAIMSIAAAVADLSARIRRGALAGAPGAAVGTNAHGDAQKALDIEADERFAAALAAAPVRWLASEERDAIEQLNADGCLAVAIDPLDGSSNIDVNVSIGTIFSIFEARETGEASFLRPGHEQIAAGYAIYGPQTALVLTVGEGVRVFLLDPESGDFVLASPSPIIPATTSELAVNASNYRHWDPPIRAFVDDALAGETGPRGRDFNMRWIASLVAEAHRILMRGGVFLYPRDNRPGYGRGRLRLLYEAAPIAFIVEQAGGAATDGGSRILDLAPPSLHARTPFVFGSAEMVDRVAAYRDLPATEAAPLFGRRGLLRV